MTDFAKAAKALIEARLEGRQLDGLPDGVTLTTTADAYAVQDAIIEQLGEPVAGWKIGATSDAVMQLLGADEPFAGPMYAPQMHSSPASLRLPRQGILGIESEFSFQLATALPSRGTPYPEDEVAAAVGAVGGFNRSSQHVQFDWPASTGPELRREFSIRGSCGAVY